MDKKDMRRLISFGNALILWNLKYGIVEYMLYQYLIVIDFSFYQSNI